MSLSLSLRRAPPAAAAAAKPPAAVGAGAEALDVERVSLRALLSACADAALRGCEEIRAVQHARASGSEVASKLKDADDPRSALTAADLAAQKVGARAPAA